MLKKSSLLFVYLTMSITLTGCPAAPTAGGAVTIATRSIAMGTLTDILGDSIVEMIFSSPPSDTLPNDFGQSEGVKFFLSDPSEQEQVNKQWQEQYSLYDLPNQPDLGNENITLECYEDESTEACVRRNEIEIKQAILALPSVNQYHQQFSEVSSKNQYIVRQAQERIQAYNAAYSQCLDEINVNPKIDLDDHVTIFDTMVFCLKNKGFESELTILAEHSSNLRDTLNSLLEDNQNLGEKSNES